MAHGLRPLTQFFEVQTSLLFLTERYQKTLQSTASWDHPVKLLSLITATLLNHVPLLLTFSQENCTPLPLHFPTNQTLVHC